MTFKPKAWQQTKTPSWKRKPGIENAKRYSKIYKTNRWRKLRHWFISVNPLCKMCKDNNVISKGEVVDHITPIQNGGSEWNVNNLQTLCNKCHKIKTNKEMNERKKNKKP